MPPAARTAEGALLSAGAADHLPGGSMPADPLGAFLAGLAHPAYTIEHLATLVAVGGLAVLLQAGDRHGLARPAAVPALFVMGSIAGFALALLGLAMDGAAFATGALAAAMGLLLIARTTPRPPVAALLIAMAGLFQGHAAALTAGGGPPLMQAAALLGVSLAQVAIILSAVVATRLATQSWLPRAAGALVLVIGVATLASAL